MGDLSLGDNNFGESSTLLLNDNPWKIEGSPHLPLLFLWWDSVDTGQALAVQAKNSKATALLSYSQGGAGAEIRGVNGVVANGEVSGVVATGLRDHGVVGTTRQHDDRAGVCGYAARYGVLGVSTGTDGAAVLGQGAGAGSGVVGQSQTGDGVQGFTTGQGTAGIFGRNDRTNGPAYGVHGSSNSKEGSGVAGVGSNGATGLNGSSDRGLGVWGYSSQRAGIMGMSGGSHGVVGSGNGSSNCGVLGVSAKGFGVGGKCRDASGVLGVSTSRDGVFGVSTAPAGYAGVAGVSARGLGVAGISGEGVGIAAHATNKPNAVGLYAKGKGAAAVLDGDVFVNGNLTVNKGFKLTVVTPANKHGVVALGNSDHLVCAIESPEAWLEDFGEAALVNGKAHVALEARFKRSIDAQRYHVFLTAYGENAGLHVSRRSASGFDVAERTPGRSNVRFSWRVVAKPRHAQHKRFDKATTPRTLERVHAAAVRNAARGLKVPVLKADGIAAPTGLARTVKRIKPKRMSPPSLPKLSKAPELPSDLLKKVGKGKIVLGRPQTRQTKEKAATN